MTTTPPSLRPDWWGLTLHRPDGTTSFSSARHPINLFYALANTLTTGPNALSLSSPEAWGAAYDKAPAWHPVSEWPANTNKEYLVYGHARNGPPFMETATFAISVIPSDADDPRAWYFNADDDDQAELSSGVTHWMELPCPPEKPTPSTPSSPSASTRAAPSAPSSTTSPTPSDTSTGSSAPTTSSGPSTPPSPPPSPEPARPSTSTPSPTAPTTGTGATTTDPHLAVTFLRSRASTIFPVSAITDIAIDRCSGGVVLFEGDLRYPLSDSPDAIIKALGALGLRGQVLSAALQSRLTAWRAIDLLNPAPPATVGYVKE